MNKVRFKLNRAGVRELLRSPEMQSVLSGYASVVRDRAGEGYEASTSVGSNRAYSTVYAETYEAAVDAFDHNTLLKAIGGGNR